MGQAAEFPVLHQRKILLQPGHAHNIDLTPTIFHSKGIENLDPQKTQCSQSRGRENLFLEKPQPTSLLLTLANHYMVNHYLANTNLPLVNLDNHILDSLYKVTLSRVTFPKVNLSRVIRQATNQVLRKAIQPS